MCEFDWVFSGYVLLADLPIFLECRKNEHESREHDLITLAV